MNNIILLSTYILSTVYLLPTAICNNCDGNRTCIAPNRCVCPTGWAGPITAIQVPVAALPTQLLPW